MYILRQKSNPKLGKNNTIIQNLIIVKNTTQHFSFSSIFVSIFKSLQFSLRFFLTLSLMKRFKARLIFTLEKRFILQLQYCWTTSSHSYRDGNPVLAFSCFTSPNGITKVCFILLFLKHTKDVIEDVIRT